MPASPSTSKRHFRVSFRVSLAVVVPLLVLAAGAFIAWWNYRSGRATVEKLSGELFRQVSGKTAERTREYLQRAAPAAETLRRLRALDDNALPREALARRFVAVLGANPGWAWVSYSDAAGAFTGAFRTPDGALHTNLSQIVDGKTVLDEYDVEAGAPDGRWTPRRHVDDTGYDPRTRPFYRAAAAARRRAWTDPYVFFDQGVPGITCAEPDLGPDGALRGVFTIDFDLNGLSEFVRGLDFTPHGRVFVFARDGTILAHPTLRLVAAAGQGAAGRLVTARDVDDVHLAAYMAAGVGATHFAAEGERYFATSRPVEIDDGVTWYVGAYAPESDFTAGLERRVIESLAISLAAVLIAVALAILLANAIAVPLVQLAGEMREVGDFRLDGRPDRHSMFRELELMNDALVKMKGGLRSFSHYVPRDLVRAVLASGQEARLAGDLRVLTVYFSDIAGFTSLAETMKPDELVRFLGGYLDEMTRLIGAHHGTVDKFLGDGIMAFWGAPLPEAEHALFACEAALACQRRLREMELPMTARIGLATGEVLVGNIGSSERMNYTVMGDTANLASRLESLNKQYGTSILVTQATFEAAGSRVIARPVDLVAVKGKARGVKVYELLAVTGVDADDAAREAWAVAKLSGDALEAYLELRFDAAAASWLEVLRLRSHDTPARVMLDRTRSFQVEPPPPDWDGVWAAKDK